MPLSNKLLNDFDSKVLQLPKEKRVEYSKQVDNLTGELKFRLKTETGIKVTTVKKAGSYAKRTILRRTNEDPVDVDVVIFIKKEGTSLPDLESIIGSISKILERQYPAKSVKDFEIQPKATTVRFKGTGLNVDIVPVIEDPNREWFGWQYDKQENSYFETCPACQIEFIEKYQEQDRHFRVLIRLAKKWRNYLRLNELKSYMIELIIAHILDSQGAIGTIEERFQKFLLYIAQSELKEVISFTKNVDYQKLSGDSVVILDPFSNNNNVANRIKESDRIKIVNTATESWEKSHFASVEEDMTIWKDVFGRRFKEEY